MAQAKKKSTDVATTEETKTAVALTDDLAALVAEDAGAGQSDMTASDLAIPRVGIIQSLSPQRQSVKPEYIEGCIEGQIFENVSKTLLDGAEGILVVPVKYNKTYLEWLPDRGGLARNHGQDATAYNTADVGEKGQHITPEGNEVIETAEYFVFIINEEDGSYSPAVLSMAKSAFKHAKRWNSMINQLKVQTKDGPVDAPMFYQAYKLTTVPESNDAGQWFRWEIESYKPITEFPGGVETYKAARSFRQSVANNAVKVAEPEAEVAGGTESDSDPM